MRQGAGKPVMETTAGPVGGRLVPAAAPSPAAGAAAVGDPDHHHILHQPHPGLQ